MADYIAIGGDGQPPVNVWWDKKVPGAIHVATNDPRFTESDGSKPGLRAVFSANPGSADYNPGNFNRCARALKAAGCAAPEEIEEHPRALAQREEVVASVRGTAL